MPSYSQNDVVLVRYPFSNLMAAKVRPAVVVNAPHASQDILIVPLTSQLAALLAGEFVLNGWQQAGLNLPSAVKRGLYTIHQDLVLKLVGQLAAADAQELERSLRGWLGLH
jgi:mRNA interferase MazF